MPISANHHADKQWFQNASGRWGSHGRCPLALEDVAFARRAQQRSAPTITCIPGSKKRSCGASVRCWDAAHRCCFACLDWLSVYWHFAFPVADRLTIELTEDSLDERQNRRGAWLELRTTDPAAMKQRIPEAELTQVAYSATHDLLLRRSRWAGVWRGSEAQPRGGRDQERLSETKAWANRSAHEICCAASVTSSCRNSTCTYGRWRLRAWAGTL